MGCLYSSDQYSQNNLQVCFGLIMLRCNILVGSAGMQMMVLHPVIASRWLTSMLSCSCGYSCDRRVTVRCFLLNFHVIKWSCKASELLGNNFTRWRELLYPTEGYKLVYLLPQNWISATRIRVIPFASVCISQALVPF